MNPCFPQITRVFYLKPSSGLACRIPGRSRRVGFWIVSSDAIAPNTVTDTTLSKGRENDRTRLKGRDDEGGMVVLTTLAVGHCVRQVFFVHPKRQLQLVENNAGLRIFLRKRRQKRGRGSIR